MSDTTNSRWSLLVCVVLVAAAVYLLWSGAQMPAQVASHFGASGRPNAYMSRALFMVVMLLVGVGIPAFTWLLHRRMVRRGKVNVPNADLWLDDTHRERTVQILDTHIAWFVLGYVAFVCFAQWLVERANAAAPGAVALDSGTFLVALGVFFVWTFGWIGSLLLRFRRRA